MWVVLFLFGSTPQIVKPTLSPYDIFLLFLHPLMGVALTDYTVRGTMEDLPPCSMHHCNLFNNLFAVRTKMDCFSPRNGLLIRIVGFSEMDDPHQKPVLFLIVAANYYSIYDVQIHCWKIGHFTSLFTKLFSLVPGVLGETLCFFFKPELDTRWCPASLLVYKSW